MKFGRFKLGTEKFGDYTTTSSSPDGAFFTTGGPFVKFDLAIMPINKQALSLTDSYVGSAAKRESIEVAVIAAGGRIIKGIG